MPTEEDEGAMEPQTKRRKGPAYDPDSWVARPVLSDEQSGEVELVEALAAPVVDKKATSRIVRALNDLYPLSGLQHIKRVRARKDQGSPHTLEVLVCLLRDAPHVQLLRLDSLLPGARWEGLGEPFVVQIPARPPLTRPQFEAASQRWPTSFHEDKQVTVALRGELFSARQKAAMHGFMTAAVAAARAGRRLGMDAVGAVVVDPERERVVAVGHDCRGDHPLHHAVMVCIDLVARSQGGGAYRLDGYEGCRFTSAEAEPQPYICSGYDLYVTREPCVMCAMALVHSRIGRVFYGTTSADGALGTRFKIHSLKDLNHRFEVFSGVLSNECDGLQKQK
ncbi:putative inactive tRNA-specific adenosine deaminase-like protein 3 [Austrofundulus limnaeus]|uniref:Inactive tRNA-specific adenosine deaminase-like protein 3 n=1 Tax=Austrofundulus limnaeus TaxID=52670 RepID=A0A2I4CNV7_AUSLI|nr:PREDICTED: probable inactive tRNA-specific adenosine deaminase-like protein 3 [Austrofundulus limnaeus]